MYKGLYIYIRLISNELSQLISSITSDDIVLKLVEKYDGVDPVP